MNRSLVDENYDGDFQIKSFVNNQIMIEDAEEENVQHAQHFQEANNVNDMTPVRQN